MDHLRQLYLTGGYFPNEYHLCKLLLPAALLLAVVSLVRKRPPILIWLTPPLLLLTAGSFSSAAVAVHYCVYAYGNTSQVAHFALDQATLLYTSGLLLIAAYGSLFSTLLLVPRRHRRGTWRRAGTGAGLVLTGFAVVWIAVRLAGGALPILLIPYTMLAAGGAMALVSSFDETSELSSRVAAVGRLMVSLTAVGAVAALGGGVYRYGQHWTSASLRLDSSRSLVDAQAVGEATSALGCMHGILCTLILVACGIVVAGPGVRRLVWAHNRGLWLRLGGALVLLVFVRFVHGGVFAELERRAARRNEPNQSLAAGTLPLPVSPGVVGDLHVQQNSAPLFTMQRGQLTHLEEFGTARRPTLGYAIFDLLTRRIHSRRWSYGGSIAHSVFRDFAPHGALAMAGEEPVRGLLPHLAHWGAQLALPLDFQLQLGGCEGLPLGPRGHPNPTALCAVSFRWMPSVDAEFWADMIYRNHPALTLADTEDGTLLWVPGEPVELIGHGADAHQTVAEHVYARTPSAVVLVPAERWTTQDLVSLCLASWGAIDTTRTSLRGEFACYVSEAVPVFPEGNPAQLYQPDRFVQDEWFLGGLLKKQAGHCHYRALEMDPTLTGSMTVGLPFGAEDGHVFPWVDASTLNNPEMESCVLEKMKPGVQHIERSNPRPVSVTLLFPLPEEPTRSMLDGWEIGDVVIERASFQPCHAEALLRKPDLDGGIEFRYRIEADGVPRVTEIVRSSLDDPIMERCVTRQFERHRFGRRPSGGSGGGSMTITFVR